MKNKYEFKGWWEDGEKEDSPEPWETFKVVLFGLDGGDMVVSATEIDKILNLAGYELILRKKK